MCMFLIAKTYLSRSVKWVHCKPENRHCRLTKVQQIKYLDNLNIVKGTDFFKCKKL